MSPAKWDGHRYELTEAGKESQRAREALRSLVGELEDDLRENVNRQEELATKLSELSRESGSLWSSVQDIRRELGMGPEEEPEWLEHGSGSRVFRCCGVATSEGHANDCDRKGRNDDTRAR